MDKYEEQSSNEVNILSDKQLQENLELLLITLKSGEMTEQMKEVLSNFFEGPKKLDPETMKYLFTGWFIYQEAERRKKETIGLE